MQQKDSQQNLLALTSNIKTVIDRYDTLTKLMKNALDITERPYIDMLFHEMSDKLTDTEITSIVLYLRSKAKQLGSQINSKDLLAKIHAALHPEQDPWAGYHYVGHDDGSIYIQLKKDRITVSNFILEPQHTITVANGYKYHVYHVKVKGDPKSYELVLKASDFNSLAALQAQIEKQLGHTSAVINGCSQFMKDLAHRYITLARWEYEKEGTSLIGLEVINGKKYFCTPNIILDVDGKESSDLVYMGNEQSNAEEISKLTNLNYDRDKWYGHIAPNFLKHVIKINDRQAMLSLLGWMGAIPHDYVLRKECNLGYFPHCHLVGEPGSGKSTILTLLKQFMGHNDSSPSTFSTKFALETNINYSYTIPAVLDEYGTRWDDNKTKSMNEVLVNSFTRSRYSKGRSDQTSVYYKYKNPILYAGQIPTSDGALATRIVPIYLYKSFHHSKKGASAHHHLLELQNMEDKNFWAGYNLWCAKHSNEEVKQQYAHYLEKTKAEIKDHRVANIYAIVMLGLHYMLKLAKELNVHEEVDYSEEDIYQMAAVLHSAASATETDSISPLTSFLQDVATFGVRYGNSQTYGMLFGTGLAVMVQKPAHDGAGEYGRTKKEKACIYGQEMILMKIPELVKVLNERRSKEIYNEKELMTFIEAKFREAMENGGKGLVLAPRQYKNKYGWYTAFSKDMLYDMFPEYNNISWYQRQK